MQNRSPRVLYVATDGVSVRGLLRRQLAFLKGRGFEVAVASNPGPGLFETAQELGIRAFPVPMAREIAPLRDLRSLFELMRVIRKYRPDLVNAGTPKAGLLGTLAARICNVSARYYVVRGLRLETTTGIKAAILRSTERLASASATRVVCVSHSLREEYERRALARADKLVVIGAGSSQGVDLARFDKRQFDAVAERTKLNISPDDFVIGFVGRLTRDKGIPELVEAFKSLMVRVAGARLLLVGDYEAGDPLSQATKDWLENNPLVHLTGFVPDTRPYYSAMDVLAFPSHREGFPNTVLEASAMEVPVIAAAATGSVDAVENGVTGTLVPVGDAVALTEALALYARKSTCTQAHGLKGRERAAQLYSPGSLFHSLTDLYTDDFDRARVAFTDRPFC